MTTPWIDELAIHTTIWLAPLTLLVVLLTTAEAQAQSRRGSIYVINRDGTGLRDILPKENRQTPIEGMNLGQPCWSPDGKLIAFHALNSTRGSQVMVVDVFESELRALGPGSSPDWSPDGRHIAFKGSKRGGAWIMNADGSGPEEFIHSGNTEPKFSPNGRGFLYSRDPFGDSVQYLDFSSGTSHRIDATPPVSSQYISWSPDGKWIVGVNSEYLSRGYEPLFVSMDPKNHRTVTVSLAGKNHMCHSYAWSPDGKTILCQLTTVETLNSQVSMKFQIYSFDVPDLSQENVNIRPTWFEGQDPDRNNFQPAWSPDGKQIVFFSYDQNHDPRDDKR